MADEKRDPRATAAPHGAAAAPAQGIDPNAPTQQVVVEGKPVAPPAPKAPTKRLDEAPEGGLYLQNARLDPETGKHYGGQVVSAQGEVVNSFEDDEENTGKPKERKAKKAADRDET